ncbi:hypothetical protein ACH5RR_023536 [Cinchona calisaya]|uniref:Uncharacterized protein n=1 Tax=Cinchona calisaya TaxID=153742 RepID=A0ABD2ZC19_9GENT
MEYSWQKVAEKSMPNKVWKPKMVQTDAASSLELSLLKKAQFPTTNTTKDIVGVANQTAKAQEFEARQTAPLEKALEAKRHVHMIKCMSMDFRDDHHVKFLNKKKKVIFEDEVLDFFVGPWDEWNRKA